MTESSELNSLGNKERLRLPEWLAKALAEGSLDPKNLPPVVVAMLAENGALGADLEEEPPLSAEEVAIVAEAGLPAQTEEAVAVAEAPLEAESLEPVAEVAAMAAVAAPEMEPAPELESAPPVEEAPQPEAEPEPQPEVVAEPQPQPEVVSETKLEPPAEVAPQPEAAAEPQGEEVAPSEEFPPQQEESGPPEVTSEPQAEAVSEPEPPAEAVPEVKPEQQPQVAPQPEVAAEPPAVETPAPPVAKVAAEEDDDPLLGAPKRVEEAEGDEFCTPSAPPVEEAPSPHELQEREAALQARRLEDIRAQVAANLEAAPQEAANVEEGADKRQAELQQLEEMAARFDFLAFLRPRLQRMRQEGLDYGALVGLYRLASQALIDRYLEGGAEKAPVVKADVEREKAIVQKATQALSKMQQAHRQELAKVRDEAQSEVEELRRQLEEKEGLVVKLHTKALAADKRCEKLEIDVANMRSRAEKDLEFKVRKAKESVFKALLPVLDSFQEALKAQSAESSPEVESLWKGVNIIYSQLQEACHSQGLEVMEVVGQPFDPNFHEAMGRVPTSAVPEDAIYDELRRGYLLDGHLLRAPMVRIAIPDPNAPPPQTPMVRIAIPDPNAPPPQTPPAPEPAPAAEAAPATEPAPAVESTPAADSAPVVEPAPVVETAPATESASAVESAPAADSAPAVEPAPAAEAASATEPVSAVEPALAADSAPAVEPAPAVDSTPAAESASTPESAPSAKEGTGTPAAGNTAPV